MADFQLTGDPQPTPVLSEDPPSYVDGPLRQRWQQPVGQLVSVAARAMEDGARERHRIYSLMLMSLVHHCWNGNKRGQDGDYPWRGAQRNAVGYYNGGQYLGHNIGCLAVDGAGEVIDFDFNHNDLLSSSAEHAESRLVRRVFSLVQIYDNWETRDLSRERNPTEYANILSDVTIYTSLESCAQCAGIMALGKVREVVYLHRDTGMYFIGNILFNLTDGTKLPAPYPTPGDAFGFEYFTALNEAFESFRRDVGDERPFHVGASGKVDKSPSVTSFLCTDAAKEIYASGAQEFADFVPAHADYRPVATSGTPEDRLLSNSEALQHARRFLAYAMSDGRRGTPHKL